MSAALALPRELSWHSCPRHLVLTRALVRAASAGIRAMLEAAAQEAQQTVDSAGDLFRGLQAEWQVLARLPPCLWRPKNP